MEFSGISESERTVIEQVLKIQPYRMQEKNKNQKGFPGPAEPGFSADDPE
ncbi:hypothetical protein [Methanosarcina mazei]|jgi:hypothetical protein|nr:hypothetical protein [Methanosarcina mazei]MDY0248203.1 hypothetical protein [Methanosarcina mazei]WIM43647.1 hypothetical protein PSF70_02085 [Methanosarcina mazei]WIM47102.1 hypothetical protein PQQ20_02075 [Methanosarcina mazei]